MSTSKNNNPKCCICSKFIKKVPGVPKHIKSDEDAAEFSTIFDCPIIVVDMLGPYYANLNDAAIMKEIIDSPDGICNLLEPGDVFVVDRGFRDVQAHLEDKGYQVLMPALKGKRNQLMTTESNASRYVTKIRWVVEAVHGMLKQKYHLLDQKFDNKMLPRVGSFYRIASFLHNQYNKRLSSDAEYFDEIVEMMESRNNTDNTLAEEFVKDQTNVLKAQVQSRHIGRKVYRCFIEYKPDTIGWSGILRYCCECANGLRTIGCCSHVAAIIFYLAHARYLAKIPRPAEILNSLFNKDNITTVIDEDSEED
ncbi:unnamed protein product [Euphydryas editha]|uniref:DDE Tnp4 domain-containing protein n=1 Tax=Euphydryas editha TaxID=104508 RepID=A0AAU9UMR6_EUPED|nr:unnamed protein product [Euphydryas editha]